MNKITLFLVISCICLSCKKEEVFVIVPSSKLLQITIDNVVNDSTITLKWSKNESTNFKSYKLLRQATYLRNGEFGTFTEAIDSSADPDHIIFTDNNMPLARDLRYFIYVYHDSLPLIPKFENYVNYQRPNSLIYTGATNDVLCNNQQKLLYVIDDKKIIITDYTGRIKMTKEFPAYIGYCTLGDYNGTKELYVPVHDGWLHIFDASTLQLKDKIYVQGFAIGSVVTANGKLFLSSSDGIDGSDSNYLKVYDRATKTLIGRTGYQGNTRLLLLEGTSIELIGLTYNQNMVDLSWHEFTAAGIPQSKKRDSYNFMYVSILRSFPDGSKFITSNSGNIFNKSLVLDRHLKTGPVYADFAFNNDGSVIYVANSSLKRIEAVTYPALTITRIYPTKFLPYKIFRDGNTIICISKTSESNVVLGPYLLVEQINL